MFNEKKYEKTRQSFVRKSIPPQKKKYPKIHPIYEVELEKRLLKNVSTTLTRNTDKLVRDIKRNPRKFSSQ